MFLIYLSHSIGHHSPVHPALKSPSIDQKTSLLRGDGYNSFELVIENHSGTHVDAPAHFLEGGKKISEYNIDEMVFKNPFILDVPLGADQLVDLDDILDEDLGEVDVLFFRTGFERFRKEDVEKYISNNPAVAPEVVKHLRMNYPGIRCLGLDSISFSGSKYPELGVETHINAFKKSAELNEPLLLIEDMKLAQVPKNRIDRVIIVPWQINGIDSVPCTVIAVIKDG